MGSFAQPSIPPPWLRVRREPFDFGLLPIASLIHKESVPALKEIREKLIAACPPSASGPVRVTTDALASCLGIESDHAILVLDTLSAILPEDEFSETDNAGASSVPVVDKLGADVDYLILFLYSQVYKRAPHRAQHRDAATLADVWPQGPSPFDNAPQPSSALQMKTSLATRQRTQPGQAEEEINQLQFVQKHLPHVLMLLADSVSGSISIDTVMDPSDKVISAQKFEILSLFLRAYTPDAPGPIPLCEAASPFFSNSDPEMPPAAVPVLQVQEWLQKHICGTSDPYRGPTIPGSPASLGPKSMDAGVGSDPYNIGSPRKDWAPVGMTSIDGVAKMCVLKGDNDVMDGVVRIAHCHDSVVYILAALQYASVVGCSDSIVILGAVGKCVKVEACERVQLIAPCARIKISNCRDCTFFLGTNTRPLFYGDNHNVQVAPYNTFYPRLELHMARVGVDPSVNKWDDLLLLYPAEHHESLHSPREGPHHSSAVYLMQPERFVPFVVPFRSGSESQSTQLIQQQTRSNPFPLPKVYLTALQHKTKTVENLRQTLKTAVLEENRKRELTHVIQAHFKDWLLTSGNIRQVYDLARLDRDP
eukprot:TRINITY_DN10572_c0_g2_i1.p1 TRINITY_DN10572_c0_g2~~TRINITY_DN10572_c0_g2_i1.p1  ORF type:complete len:592 (+),score=129.10 TRINITY_DN10572_c0_g2_i1:85-1860(+)